MPQLKAIIEYGLVTNIIVHEGGTLTLPEGQMYVNVGDQGVNIGWSYDYATNTFYPGDGETIAQRMGKAETQIMGASAVSDIAFVALAQSGQLDDTTIAEHPLAFALWEPERGLTCNRGAVVREVLEDGKTGLFRALHDIGIAHALERPSASDLYQAIGNPEDEYPAWSPWLGVGDLYQIGDKCSSVDYGAPEDTTVYNWTSNTANNVWRPGEYGWTKDGAHEEGA